MGPAQSNTSAEINSRHVRWQTRLICDTHTHIHACTIHTHTHIHLWWFWSSEEYSTNIKDLACKSYSNSCSSKKPDKQIFREKTDFLIFFKPTVQLVLQQDAFKEQTDFLCLFHVSGQHFSLLLGCKETGSQNVVKRLRQNNLHWAMSEPQSFAPWKLPFPASTTKTPTKNYQKRILWTWGCSPNPQELPTTCP